MTNIQMIPEVVNSSVCFTTSVMLLTIKSYSEMGSKSFQLIKEMLACCGLIEVFKTLMSLACVYYNIDSICYAYFLSPALFYVQLCVVSMGLLGLVHSKKFTSHGILIALSPIGALSVIHMIGYLINSGCSISLTSYFVFLDSQFALLTFYADWAFVLAEIVMFVYLLVTETHKYRHQLVNVFSGREVVNGRKLAYLVYGFLGYFGLLIVANLIRNEVFYLFFLFFDIAIFLAGVIVLFNIQDMYSRVMLVEDYVSSSSSNEAVSSGVDQTKMQVINQSMTNWESRTDKPFLKNHLSLVDVAMDIGVQPSDLSLYLNSVCKMDFNKWLGVLRIDEAVKIISANPHVDLSEVAISVGFSGLKNMTKAFRQIIGKEPAAFVAELSSTVK